MADFEIFVDSGADLTKSRIEELGMKLIPLMYSINDGEPVPGDTVDETEFYTAMKNGANTSTSSFSPEFAREYFEPCLKEGKDVIYLGLSSGISRTCHSAQLIAEDLAEEYPNNRVYAIDTKCASLGIALVAKEALKERAAGKSVTETVATIERLCPKTAHIFTIDDLMFIMRGGRVSKASAIIGTALQIKPILHGDDNGELKLIGKVRGSKGALNELINRTINNIDNTEPHDFYICYSERLSDAETAAAKLREAFADADVTIGPIGPVIGAHAGPGCIAIFSFATCR